MSLRDELIGAKPVAPEPRGYTLLVPPDWGRFGADDAGRDELLALLRARFQAVGRPDLYGQMHASVTQQWQRMRQRGGLELFMPVQPHAAEGSTPMSILTAPWITQGSSFADDVAQRAHVANGIETLDSGDGSVVFRWESERRGSDDFAGVITREISYVRPFPGEDPRRGILIMASIVHPGEEEAGAALTAFTALADSIVSTFVWRYA
ncbi:hypothetical protein ACWIBQ_07605 [Microbacterium keratanolyticum]